MTERLTDRILRLTEPSEDEGEVLYTVTMDPTGESVLGLIVSDEGIKVITWQGESEEAVTLATLDAPAIDEIRLQAAYDRAVEALPKEVELVYIDRDDKLMDKQIQAAFKGTPPYEAADFDQWESDSRYAGLQSTLEYYVDADDLELLRRDDERFNELENVVQERDTSDPFMKLARNTPSKWMRYKLDLDAEAIWSSSPEEIDQDIANIAEALTIESTAENKALLRELVVEAGGGRLNLLWYGEVDELIVATQRSDESGNQVPQTITWVNPHLLIHDGLNGAGHMVDYVGTITLPFDRDRLKLDVRGVGNGYSWSDEVAGLAGDRDTTTVTITENK